jgi:YbgC/YbaW family acyl-CoA thioester hydrolase
MDFQYKITVRGYELDSFNHVNNAVYLNYLEQARWEILKELDLIEDIQKKGLLLVVTELNIRYMKEARLYDELVIKTTVEKEEPYLVFKHSIYNETTGLKITKATVKTLLIDKNRVPCDIPESFLKKEVK